jgi:hypothetical protein
MPLRHALAVLGLTVCTGTSSAEAQSFEKRFVAPQGCGMAHCDRDLSGAVRLPPPRGLAFAQWHDPDAGGSQYGLGCSSNGTVAICTFANSSDGPPNVKAYSIDGVQLWSSPLLNKSAADSAPIVDPSGGAIVADSASVVRYDASGAVLWTTATPGGTPISPNITDNGAVVLATFNGPVSTYDLASGAPLGILWLTETLVVDGQSVPGFFDTINTPAVSGNRVYVSTQFHRSVEGPPVFRGRLYAIDVTRPDPAGPAQLTVAWYFEFVSPSGASPLLIPDGPRPVLYFDGNGSDAAQPRPTFFAVQDQGSSYLVRWQVRLPGKMLAAAVRDPRGGLWLWAGNSTKLLRLSLLTGAVRETLDVDALINEPDLHMPTSPMSISMSGAAPVMILCAWTKTTTGSSDLAAIDLAAAALQWKIPLGSTPASVAFGQYPILLGADARPIVVFSTFGNGVWGIAAE